MFLEIRRTKEKGFGLFTLKNISKGDLVFEITGEVKTNKEWNKTNADENHLHQIDRNRFMLVNPPSCFCNHSCNPNSGLKNGTKFYALRNIKSGEEITVDYDTFEWDWIMNCNCKEKNCRTIIRGFKSLPVNLKKRYARQGIVAEYLLKYA